MNIVVSVLAMMIAIFNSILILFVFEDKFKKILMVTVLYVFQTSSLILTNYDLSDLSSHSIISIVIAILFTAILVPAFIMIISTILNESLEHLQSALDQRQESKDILDCL